MICRVNEEEEEEEREPRGEMMNEPLSTPPLFLSVHSEISFLPAPYFFFSRWGTINRPGNFLSNVHAVRSAENYL